MITPAYSLTATERILPSVSLDFTTATLDSRVAVARSGNTATVTNSSGNLALVNANLPRFDFDPVTLACRGLLIESSRTNLLLNSLIDGTSLTTQIVVVTAAAHTLTFYGTGQIVLSGAASATVTGTGAYPTRTTLTFTPSAGVLTLTVTGTVQYAQLELGAFSTSFIPTAGSTVTRTADDVTMTGTNFSSWFKASAGSVMVQFTANQGVASLNVLSFEAASAPGANISLHRESTTWRYRTDLANLNLTGLNLTTQNKTAFYYASSAYKAASNGGAALTNAGSGGPPAVTQLFIGKGNNYGAASYMNGLIAKMLYWPQRITDSELSAFSK
jgi:hypothetical protein